MYSLNIKKNYIFSFLMNFNVTSAIWMIYLSSKGMSLTQLGLLEGLFHITSFLMEVPTGAIADIFGRKISRTLERVFAVLSNAIILFSNNIYLFILGFAISAISYNLESGSGEALIYDSLKEMNQENTYSKIAGTIEVMTQLGMMSGYILGGYLAKNSYELAYIISIVIGVLSILQSLTFKEPNIEMKKNKNVLIQAKESLKIIIKNKKIMVLILIMEAITTFTTCIFFYLQNYFLENGFNQLQIGLFMAIASVFSALGAAYTHKIEKVFSKKILLKYIPLIMAVFVWGIALSKYLFVYFALISGLEGILYVVYSSSINKLIPSNKRATILSFASMVFSLYMMLLFPLFGKIADIYSLKISFMALAVLISALEVLIISKLKYSN